MADQDKIHKDIYRGHLAKQIRAEVDDMLEQQKDQIIGAVMATLGRNETLEPQFAVQQWLMLYAVEKFKRRLLKDERRMASSGKQVTPDRLT